MMRKFVIKKRILARSLEEALKNERRAVIEEIFVVDEDGGSQDGPNIKVFGK